MSSWKHLFEEEAADFATIAIWVSCYDCLQEEQKSLNQIAIDLAIGKDRLYRALEAMKTMFPRSKGIIGTGKGRSSVAAVATHDDVGHFRAEMENVLSAYQSATRPEILRIRVGTGITLDLYIVPRVLRAFRQGRLPTEKDEVYVVHGLPQELRKQGEKGELDIVLISVAGGLREHVTGFELVDEIELPMRLILPRDHRLVSQVRDLMQEERKEEAWELLGHFSVVLLQGGREPMPQYTETIVSREATAARIEHVESIPQLHYCVTAGGDVLSFSFPHVFSPQDQSSVDSIAVPGLKPLRVALLWSNRAKERKALQKDTIQRLLTIFKNELQTVRESIEREQSVQPSRATQRSSPSGQQSRRKSQASGRDS